jgi:cardiolipin synthase A/B
VTAARPTPGSEHHHRVFVGADAFLNGLRRDLVTCTTSLRVQFSTFEGDDAGQSFATLLLDRAAAGVAVQLVLDGYSEVIADDVYPFAIRGRKARDAERHRTVELLSTLEVGGVAIQRVAPMGRFARYFAFRDHKKMVVIDDAVAYVGGINVSDHNFAWHDFMVRIDGAVVGDIVADFTSTWSGATIALTEPREDRDYALNQSAGRPTVLDEALRLVDGASRRIVVESPYLCGDRIQGALLAAAERGVKIVLVTPARPNHVHNRMWIRKLRRRLQHPNIDLLGYSGSDGMTHAKLLIVDDRVATFGSLNFQEIEALTQKELNVVTRDPELVTELLALVEADAAASESVDTPRTAFGWFTYRVAYRLLRAWTLRLLKRPAWRARYC